MSTRGRASDPEEEYFARREAEIERERTRRAERAAADAASAPRATSASSVDRERASHSMNRLIGACKNDARVLAEAADIVVRPHDHDRLVEQVRRREAFVNELSASVVGLGGKPRSHGSARSLVGRAFRDLRASIIGGNRGDAYATCTRVEARTEAAYEAVLDDRNLPPEVRTIIERQREEISLDYIELRRLRSSG